MLVQEIADDVEEVEGSKSRRQKVVRRQSSGTGRRIRRDTHAGAFSVVAVIADRSRLDRDQSGGGGGGSAGDEE